MALVECKECKSRVYEYADSCPHCGVRNPGISYEEERLAEESKRFREDEERYADRYRSLASNSLREFLNRREINKYVDLANEAQSHARELEEQLAGVRRNKKRYIL
jgi:uncharacterized Zn finger protein (UPF0148 family)